MRKFPFEVYLFTAMSGIALFLILVNTLQHVVLKTYYISNYFQTILFLADFILGIIVVMVAFANKGYKTTTTAIDYKPLNRAIFILFAFVSSLIAFLFIAAKIGLVYEIPLFAALLPTYVFDLPPNLRDSDARDSYLKKNLWFVIAAIAIFIIAVTLDLINLLFVWNGVLILAAFSILLPTRETRKENEIKVLTFRTLSPIAAVSMIYAASVFYLDTISSGYVFFYAITLLVIAIMILVFRIRYRSVLSGILNAFLVGLSFIGFYIIYHNFNRDTVWLTLLLLFTFWVFGYNYKVFREGSRNISTSFDLMGKGKYIIPSIGLIITIGLAFGNIGALSHDFNVLWTTKIGGGTTGILLPLSKIDIVPVYLGLSALGIFFTLTLGYRKFNLFLFAVILVMFFIAVVYLLSIKVANVWTPSSTEVSSLSIILTALIFYEPVYRFVRSYTSRIPSGLSIGKRTGAARFIHGRYDVSMIPSKKNNPDFLGAGGFAYVFRGKDVLKNIPVVLKVPRIFDEESKSELEKRESIKESIKQIEAESNVLSEISFPGVVSYIEYFREGGQHFLVEEYADGRNLNSYLATKGKEGTKFSEEELIRISLNLLFSVNYLHLHEIFHRDLNPGNIVLTKKIPKIIDFGTSKHLASKVSASFFTHSDRIGVPCYHPPELDSEDKIKASSTYDTYSIGALMCSMITGKFLDNDEMREKYGVEFITRKYLDTEIKPFCNPKIFDIIVKATSLKPSERYQSAFHFIADFLSLSGEFIVTDMGYICRLDQEHKFQIYSHKDIPASIFGDYMINDYVINITERGKDERSRIGTIEYDSRAEGYVVYPYGKRVVYHKKAGSLSQKVIRGVLNEGDIISLRPDLREGTFSFYRVS
jgi:serine/threonine protein kinase